MRALTFGGALDRVRGGQQTARHRLGQLAQPRGLVHRFADDRVLETFVGADVAGNHLTCGHPDAGLALGHLGAQPFGDRARRGQGRVLGMLQVVGGAEHRQAGVTLEFVQQSAVGCRPRPRRR